MPLLETLNRESLRPLSGEAWLWTKVKNRGQGKPSTTPCSASWVPRLTVTKGQHPDLPRRQELKQIFQPSRTRNGGKWRSNIRKLQVGQQRPRSFLVLGGKELEGRQSSQ